MNMNPETDYHLCIVWLESKPVKQIQNQFL